MQVKLYLNDGRIVNITSDQGRYQKQSHDCWFEKNVVADDGETKIFAENLDLLATENFVKIYKQVKLYHSEGSLEADQVNYDFIWTCLDLSRLMWSYLELFGPIWTDLDPFGNIKEMFHMHDASDHPHDRSSSLSLFNHLRAFRQA